ncbi:MAG: hypothetical protein COB36_11390 [Alphaproteobacteria bacterium]|nr:MAG: hypothetical protein COB36_11390 [Alphaproteobacteria bacterium]
MVSAPLHKKTNFRKAATAASLLLLSACGPASTVNDNSKNAEALSTPLLAIDQVVAPSQQVAYADGGMISSAHPLATMAGKLMLEQGGTAADAAVAVGFALSVVEPSMSGIGGRIQILVRDNAGNYQGYDAMTELGENYVQPKSMVMSGYSIVGVPGVPAGLLKLHAEYGKLPLATVMEPAIRYAEDGHALMAGEVSRRARAEKAIKKDLVLAAAFLDENGALYDEADFFKQTDQAATLKKIRDGGHDAFYKGEIARAIVADMAANGGSVTYNSLTNYKVVSSRLPHTTYRGYEVWGVDAPGNGTSIVESLNIMKNFDVPNMDDTSWAILTSQATGISIWDTMLDMKGKLLERNTSTEWAKKRASEIKLPTLSKVSQLNSDGHKFSTQYAMLNPDQVDWAGEENGKFSHHTTHHVSADGGGLVVSVTQTLGPNMGAKVMTKGLGFLYAQTGGMPAILGKQAPGDRPRTNIAPTIITKDGKFVMALGAAGGTRIPTAIVQVISRVIDQGMSLEDAIAAPRAAPKFQLRPKPGFAPGAIQLETTAVNGWSQDVIDAIKAAGFKVDTINKYSVFGRVNALAWDADRKTFVGVADLDWEGVSAGPNANKQVVSGHEGKTPPAN